MKWILLTAAVLVALVALMAVVGALLPRGHVASCVARFKQPRQALWQALTDPAAMPSWRPDVKKVERLPDREGKPVWREIGSHGAITLEVTESSPEARLVTRIADPDLPFGGTWTYELREAGGGSELKITENGEVKNAVFRFMARFVFGHHRTMQTYLEALGRKLGEDVVPARVE